MDSLADWAASRLAVEVFTGVVVQATIILGIAWLATTLLRRASAALRHGVWSLALLGLLMLPALSVFLPSWNIGMPEGLQVLLIHDRAVEAPREAVPALMPAPVRPFSENARQQPAAAASSEKIRLDAAGTATPLGVPGPAWIVLIWGAGMLMLVGRLMLHGLRLRVLARHAERLTDTHRLAEITHLARGLGIRRRVRILCSPEVSMAMTWGLWHPVVLLPYQARFWPDERRRVVLLHELAHVKRWDYLIHLVTQVARACYWFNPLVWVAARRIHVEQERACDDEVLQTGAGACDYATHLIDIARSFLKRPAPLPGGIAAVRGSTLKERVWAILNAPNRHALSLKTGLAAACTGACLILPVAALHLCAPALEGGAAPPVASALDPGITLPFRAGPTTSTDRLMARLDDEHAVARLEAVRALAQREDWRALDRLAAMLHDDDCPDVRAAAVQAIEKICPFHALASVPAALSDQNAQVRLTAARALGQTIDALYGSDSPKAHRALQDHLSGAVEALKAVLNDEAAPVREEALRTLKKIDAPCNAS